MHRQLDTNQAAASHAPPRRRASRRLQAIRLLPSAATLGNLIAGFLAIFCCLLEIRAQYLAIDSNSVHPQLVRFFPTYLAIGAYLVVAGMICDALDGRLARLARRTTEFGAQLDSIADIVTFGVAPALLFLTLLLQRAVPLEPPATVSALLWRLGLLAALVYISCAAIRLARFNAESVRDESGVKSFSGLPVPGAAAVITSLLILHEDLVRTGWAIGDYAWSAAVRWTLTALLILLGWLMVSRLDYLHVFNVYVARRKHPPDRLVWLLVVIGLVWVWPQGLLVILALAYLVSGFLLNLRRRSDAPRPVTSGARKSPLESENA